MAVSVVAGLAAAGSAAVGGAVLAGAVSGLAIGWGVAAAAFAIGAGLSMVGRALVPKPKVNTAASLAGLTTTVREPATSKKLIYGRTRIGGTIVYVDTTGTDNEYLHFVVVLAGHEIDAYEAVYFNDEKVWQGTYQSGWGSYARIKFYKGDQTTADSDLVSESTPWTSNHILNGNAYMYVRLKYDADQFPNGIPNISAIVRGKKIYDPRQDSTSTHYDASVGVNTHRVNDASTWTWSQNPALAVRDYLVDTQYGLGETASAINSAALVTAADYCDVDTDINSDPIPALQINGVVDTANSRKENIDSMLSAMGGMLVYSGGQYYVRAAQYLTPSVTVDETMMVGQIQVQTRQSRRSQYNGVKGVFLSKEKNYVVADYPAQISSTYATDDGDPIYLDMPLPFVTNNEQAQRLAKIGLLKSRQQTVITVPLNLSGLKFKAGDFIYIDNDKLGWDGKAFEVLDYGIAVDNDGSIRVDVRCIETAASIYNWLSNDAADFLSGGEITLYDGKTTQPPTSLTATESPRINSDGAVIPTIELGWTAAADAFVDHYEVEWKQSTASTYKTVNTVGTEYEIPVPVVGVTYNTRVRAVNALGVRSTYATANVTMGGDTTAPASPTSPGTSADVHTLVVSWTNPSDLDLSYIEVKRNSVNTEGTATVVGRSSGTSFVDGPFNVATTYYYWVRAVDNSGNASSWVSAGSDTTVAVDTADIKDNAVDITKIADTLQSTNYSAGSAGWKLTTDGTFEAGNGTFRGALTATSGSIASTVTIGGTAASTVVSGAADGATALQNGDDITDGTIGGVTITSTKLYQGTGTFNNSNTGFYLDSTGQFSLKDKLAFFPSDNTLRVKGNIEADVITVNQNLQVVGDLKASSLAIASITREMFTQDALDEIYGALATAVGGTNGDYKEASGDFTTSGGTVTLALFDHGQNDVVVEWLENYGFSQAADYTGTALQATLIFEASTTSNFATIAASKTETITLNKYDLSVYYGSTYFWYYGPRTVTKTFTTTDLADTTDYYFRVRVTSVGAAFTGITYPFELEANEGVTGVVSTGGNADTLDNLDSTAFLRSNVDDTFDGNRTVTGNLTVQGTTVSLDVTNLNIEDKNITLASGAANATAAQGAGITIDGANRTFTYTAGDKFETNTGLWAYGNDQSASNYALVGRDSAGNNLLLVRNDGIVQVPSGYFYASNSAGAYFTGEIRARGGISNDQGDLLLNDNVNVNGTLTIDHSTFGEGLVLERQDGTNSSSIKFTNTAGTAGILYGRHSDNELVWRDGTSTNNFMLWHQGNDGPNSGLDADTVDGLDASSLLRSDANDLFSGDYLEFQDNCVLRFGNGADYRIWHDGASGDTYFRNYGAGGNTFFQGEDSGGTNHAMIYLRGDTSAPYVQLYYDGGEVLRTSSGGVTITNNITSGGINTNSTQVVLGGSSFSNMSNAVSVAIGSAWMPSSASLFVNGFSRYNGALYISDGGATNYVGIGYDNGKITATGGNGSGVLDAFDAPDGYYVGNVNVITSARAASFATLASGSTVLTDTYTGGTGDFTNISTPQLKIAAEGTTYWRIPHVSGHSTVSGVYNYQTGKDVYWGEPGDTGVYRFRGRDLRVDDGNLIMGAQTALEVASSYLRINQGSYHSNGVWFGSSDVGSSSGTFHWGSNGAPTTARVIIEPGTYDGNNVIKLDGADGHVTGRKLEAVNSTTANELMLLHATSDRFADAIFADNGGSIRLRQDFGEFHVYTGGAANSTNASGAAVKFEVTASGINIPAGNLQIAGTNVLTSGRAALNLQRVSLDASSGNGYNFWDGNGNYVIYMSAQSDSTYGGRVTGETSSDYNMYFKMQSGTNRGFVFRDNTNNYFSINPSGFYSEVPGIISNKINIRGDHSSNRLHLEYRHANTDSDGNNGDLLLWTSEPGITYDCSGIGANIHPSGQYYGRADNANPYGLYMRFDVNDGEIEFWNTTGSSGSTGGQGTRRAYIDVSGGFHSTDLEVAGVLTLSNSSDRSGLLDIQNTGQSWTGVQFTRSAGDHWSVMGNDTNFGLYDDQNGDWILLHNQNAGTSFYYNGNVAFSTTTHGIGSSAKYVAEHGSANRNAGYYGEYSPTRLAHIWSMGTAYQIAADGNSASNIFGLTYSYNPNYQATGNNPGAISGLGHQMQWRTNGATHTAIGTGVYTIGNVTAYSDRRVKTNIQRIPDALNKVCKLNGYTYERTDLAFDEATGEKQVVRQAGVIAQEVLEVLPEVVTGSEELHYGVAYGNMVSLLIEAIKELKDEVDSLKSQLKEKDNGDH